MKVRWRRRIQEVLRTKRVLLCDGAAGDGVRGRDGGEKVFSEDGVTLVTVDESAKMAVATKTIDDPDVWRLL